MRENYYSFQDMCMEKYELQILKGGSDDRYWKKTVENNHQVDLEFDLHIPKESAI